MNYDITTEQGMGEAKTWMANVLARLSDRGVWFVPRSGSTVSFNQTAKTARISSLCDDPSLGIVLREMGYTVEENRI